ncbi:hypothetical protein GCM10010517_12870 [Streptosporangium fragile]|uniref:Zinc finger DksA/TraR C4-type domain-containing protein n=1 Tax=Streptosporangium fragile TaxID=46186 RepID=A0ABN3VT80_9ACTN
MSEQLSDEVLSVAERATMRDLLMADRESTVIEIAALTRDWDDIVESSVLMAADDEQDPEVAAIAFERAHIQALLGQIRNHLDDLDEMIERLDKGTYGVCERCGRPIAFERLQARPVARTCIGCAARRR